MTVVFSEPALDDLEDYRAYVEGSSSYYAERAVRKLVEAAEGLAKYPFIGRPLIEFPRLGLRQLLVRTHRIVYSVDEETSTVRVVRFFHVKRLLKESDLNP